MPWGQKDGRERPDRRPSPEAPTCASPDWRARLAATSPRARSPSPTASTTAPPSRPARSQAVTGIDPRAGLGIRYTTLRRRPPGAAPAAATRPRRLRPRAGSPRSRSLDAQQGDLAVIETASGPALGVVGGAVVLAADPAARPRRGAAHPDRRRRHILSLQGLTLLPPWRSLAIGAGRGRPGLGAIAAFLATTGAALKPRPSPSRALGLRAATCGCRRLHPDRARRRALGDRPDAGAEAAKLDRRA